MVRFRFRFHIATMMAVVAAAAVMLTAVNYTQRLGAMTEQEKTIFLFVLLLILFVTATFSVLGLIFLFATWLAHDERHSTSDPNDPNITQK